MKRAVAFLIFCVVLALAGSGCASVPGASPAVAEPLLPERVEIYFFHDTSCGSCDGTTEFYDIFQEEIGAEMDRYPYRVETGNVFQGDGRLLLQTVCEEWGLDPEVLYTPLMIVHGKTYQGLEAIRANIREAFLTAREDIFENRYVYRPKDAGEALFDEAALVGDAADVVYFYRITCAECEETAPVINSFPEYIRVGEREVPVRMHRFNTRSGRNNKRIQAFFAAYQVPAEDQMVPIVFLADGYLAGYEAISSRLEEMLFETASSHFEWPEAG